MEVTVLTKYSPKVKNRIGFSPLKCFPLLKYLVFLTCRLFTNSDSKF